MVFWTYSTTGTQPATRKPRQHATMAARQAYAVVLVSGTLVCLFALISFHYDGAIRGTHYDRELLVSTNQRHWPRQFIAVGNATLIQSSNNASRVLEYQMGYHTAKEQEFINEELVEFGEASDKYFRQHTSWNPGSGLDTLRPWQTAYFPTCNEVHGVVDPQPEAWKERHRNPNNELLTDGGRNWVFSLANPGTGEKYIWKMYDYSYEGEDFSVGREGGATNEMLDLKQLHYVAMDALVMERTTACPYTIPIYGHCGLDILTELSQGSFDSHELGEALTPQQRLRYAIQVAGALAAIENIDGDGIPSYVHCDLKPDQFLYFESTDTIKLNDFNIGAFLSRNKTTGEPQGSFVQHEGGAGEVWRSPEEHLNFDQNGPRLLTPKMVVYSMCHELQRILTGEGVSGHLTHNKVLEGIRTPLPAKIAKSVDPIIMGYRETLDRCFAFKPEDRASAMEVLAALQQVQARFGRGAVIKRKPPSWGP